MSVYLKNRVQMCMLDGLAILRFTNAGRSGGGVETYLDDLDRTLLTRSKVEVIRMYLEEELKGEKKIAERIGRGTLVLIPLEVGVGATQAQSDKEKIRQSRLFFLKGIVRELIVYNPFLYRVFFRDYLGKHFPRPNAFGFVARNAREAIRKIFQEYNVDLIVMHHVGGVDSAEIIEEAKQRKVPYIFLNHFTNDNFNNISVREQLNGVAGVAGVSAVGVPRRLKRAFVNLSDGIDTELFSPDHARPLEVETNTPIIIYPARIVRVKGQIDLIKACAKLRSDGLRVKVVFAGRRDSMEYEEELRRLASKSGIGDDVLFVGQLDVEKLRDWYGISSVLGFPTYCKEGFPRILMEAQAMKVTPIAYDVGGMSEGIQHGKTGLLVRRGDIQTFTKSLEYLLTHEEQRRKMGEEGREFVKKHFSLEALADRHEKYYLRILKNAGKCFGSNKEYSGPSLPTYDDNVSSPKK